MMNLVMAYVFLGLEWLNFWASVVFFFRRQLAMATYCYLGAVYFSLRRLEIEERGRREEERERL
jgi:hypothetical protein